MHTVDGLEGLKFERSLSENFLLLAVQDDLKETDAIHSSHKISVGIGERSIAGQKKHVSDVYLSNV